MNAGEVLRIRGAKPRFTLAIVGLAFCGAAQAGCVDLPSGSKLHSAYSYMDMGQMLPAVSRPGQDARFLKVGESALEGAAIVGLWEFEFRAKGNAGIPDGALIDFGTVIWHDDGTEVTVSGGRTPAVGDVCMGTWRQVGHSTFRLTHVAMGYGPPQGPVGDYGGPTAIQAQVTVGPGGDTYDGNFKLTQYKQKFDPAVPNSEFDQSEVAFSISGSVTGTRITPK